MHPWKTATWSTILFLALTLALAGCGAPASTPTPPPVRLPTPEPLNLPTIAWTPAPPHAPARISSPSPTPTPTGTPTPRPLPYGWVKPYRARLRAAPSTEAEVVALVPAGTTLRLLGSTPDGKWYRVRTVPLQGKPMEGWMAAEVVVTFASPNEIP